VTKLFGQDHRSGDNWTGQGTAARFINSSNARGADGAELFLVTKSAAPIHFRDLTIRRFNDLPNSLNHSMIKSLNDLSFPHRGRFLAFAFAKII
jgi:hypothetical protein